MKYRIVSYDEAKDVAVVDFSFKFKGVEKVESLMAHNLPVDDKDAMDAFALDFVEAKKNELRQTTKKVAKSLEVERTVVEKAGPVA